VNPKLRLSGEFDYGKDSKNLEHLKILIQENTRNAIEEITG